MYSVILICFIQTSQPETLLRFHNRKVCDEIQNRRYPIFIYWNLSFWSVKWLQINCIISCPFSVSLSIFMKIFVLSYGCYADFYALIHHIIRFQILVCENSCRKLIAWKKNIISTCRAAAFFIMHIIYLLWLLLLF